MQVMRDAGAQARPRKFEVRARKNPTLRKGREGWGTHKGNFENRALPARQPPEL